MTVHVENSKELIKKIPRTSEFSKVGGYKTNIQKLIVFLYISNKCKTLKLKIQCHIQLLKRMKYLDEIEQNVYGTSMLKTIQH